VPKITEADIAVMGFTAAMFNLDNAGFTAMAAGVISEQAELLEGRIGSTLYATSAKPDATYVKRAEKCLVAAELLSQRLIILGQEVQAGDGDDAHKIRNTQKQYAAEAELMISRIAAGTSADGSGYSGGVVSTTHSDNLGWP